VRNELSIAMFLCVLTADVRWTYRESAGWRAKCAKHYRLAAQIRFRGYAEAKFVASRRVAVGYRVTVVFAIIFS